MSSKKLRVAVALVVSGLAAALVTVLAGGAGGATAPVGSGKQTATKSVCGLGTGKKATGAPIKVGGLVTFEPGTDFQDIAKAAVFLVSDAAAFITGHSLPVDGGNLALNAGGSKIWPTDP